jgi:hypothetical protein
MTPRYVALLALVACSTGPSNEGATTSSIVDPRVDVYPVDPQLHVEDKSLDASKPGTVRASVLNAVAYARYGASLLEPEVPASPSTIAEALVVASRESAIPTATVLRAFAAEASPEAVEAYRVHAVSGARGLPASAPLPIVLRRAATLHAQLDACGADAARCCAALATPWFFLDAWPSLTADARAALETHAADGSLHAFIADEALARSASQPFEHQSIKAWLAVCAPIVRHLPATLDELRARYGDYRRDPRYTVELHPVSMAKLAPRRIYRRADMPVSIAESLGEDCAVRETELVVGRGPLDFASYGADGRREELGYFPAQRGVDAIKPTPDSCLGCHYKLDTRAFDVRTPSYVALGLELRERQGVPQWIDGSGCRTARDRIVWHVHP